MAKETIYNLVRQEWSSDAVFKRQLLNPSSKNYPNSFYKFVSRVIKSEGWTERCRTVSQTVPPDWREKAVQCASRIRERMRSKKIDALIALDEVSVCPYFSDTLII